MRRLVAIALEAILIRPANREIGLPLFPQKTRKEWGTGRFYLSEGFIKMLYGSSL